jgi:hypothetical protein
MCRWDDNIQIYFKEIVWERVEWIKLAQDKDPWQAVMNMVMKLMIPEKATSSLTN